LKIKKILRFIQDNEDRGATLIEYQNGNICYLQFNHYQQFPELTHGIFTRQGGCSEAPYRGLNTSTSLKGGDSIENVASNRQLTLQALDIAHYPCVTLWQVHGADVVTVDTNDEEWRTDWAYSSYYYQKWTAPTIRKGDALISKQRGLALALSFADCTPITFYDPVEQVIGIAHGGWRGTARGIVFATVETLQQQFGCRVENIYAGIGPAIGPCCYEVSRDVEEHFLDRVQFADMPTNERYRALVREAAVFSVLQQAEKESLRLDLRATNRKQLQMAGLDPAHIEDADICTGCNTDSFFSHRCEKGLTGRFPVIMALQEEQ
jgi:YfiH family protein